MIGPAIGPTLGGYIVDNFPWPWIFYINVPIGIAGLVMVARVVHDPPYLQRTREGADWIGLALLVVGLAALQTLLEQGEQNDWFESRLNVLYGCVATSSLVMFVVHELTTERPIVNLRVLSDRSFATGTAMGAVLGAVLFSTLFLLPVYMQEFLHYNAMQTGLALMPRSIAMLVTIPFVGALYNRLSPRLFIAFGLSLGAITCVMMSHFTLQTSREEILWPQVLQGVALACIFIPLSTVALSTIDRRRMSEATGLNNLVRQLGGSFGVAIFASQLGRFIHTAKATLSTHLAVTDPNVQERLGAMRAGLGRGVDVTTASERALRVLDGQVSAQAAMLGFEKAFYVGGLLFAFSIPLVLLLKAPKVGVAAPKAEHAAVEL
jgi:DHA2 family multidrug resistance protein